MHLNCSAIAENVPREALLMEMERCLSDGVMYAKSGNTAKLSEAVTKVNFYATCLGLSEDYDSIESELNMLASAFNIENGDGHEH